MCKAPCQTVLLSKHVSCRLRDLLCVPVAALPSAFEAQASVAGPPRTLRVWSGPLPAALLVVGRPVCNLLCGVPGNGNALDRFLQCNTSSLRPLCSVLRVPAYAPEGSGFKSQSRDHTSGLQVRFQPWWGGGAGCAGSNQSISLTSLSFPSPRSKNQQKQYLGCGVTTTEGRWGSLVFRSRHRVKRTGASRC